MKCKETKTRLSAYLDGELNAETASRIAAHLQGCERCRRLREQLEWGYARIAAEAVLPPDPFMAARVRAHLQGSRRAKGSQSQLLIRWLIPVTMAAGLLLGMLLGEHLSDQWPQPAGTSATAELLEVTLLNQLPESMPTTTFLDLTYQEGVAHE